MRGDYDPPLRCYPARYVRCETPENIPHWREFLLDTEKSSGQVLRGAAQSVVGREENARWFAMSTPLSWFCTGEQEMCGQCACTPLLQVRPYAEWRRHGEVNRAERAFGTTQQLRVITSIYTQLSWEVTLACKEHQKTPVLNVADDCHPRPVSKHVDAISKIRALRDEITKEIVRVSPPACPKEYNQVAGQFVERGGGKMRT